MASTDPTSIKVDLDASRLVIGWKDGHESRYTGAYLRWTCPCAACRGHGPGQVPPPAWEAVRGVRILNAAAVGSYAIRFDFSDAHDSGIFSFEHLRRSCPLDRDDVDADGVPLEVDA
jgi:DUF971 family protein